MRNLDLAERRAVSGAISAASILEFFRSIGHSAETHSPPAPSFTPTVMTPGTGSGGGGFGAFLGGLIAFAGLATGMAALFASFGK